MRVFQRSPDGGEAADAELAQRGEGAQVRAQAGDLLRRCERHEHVPGAVLVALHRQLRALHAEGRQQRPLVGERAPGRDRLLDGARSARPARPAARGRATTPIPVSRLTASRSRASATSTAAPSVGMTGEGQLGRGREDADAGVPALAARAARTPSR